MHLSLLSGVLHLWGIRATAAVTPEDEWDSKVVVGLVAVTRGTEGNKINAGIVSVADDGTLWVAPDWAGKYGIGTIDEGGNILPLETGERLFIGDDDTLRFGEHETTAQTRLTSLGKFEFNGKQVFTGCAMGNEVKLYAGDYAPCEKRVEVSLKGLLMDDKWPYQDEVPKPSEPMSHTLPTLPPSSFDVVSRPASEVIDGLHRRPINPSLSPPVTSVPNTLPVSSDFSPWITVSTVTITVPPPDAGATPKSEIIEKTMSATRLQGPDSNARGHSGPTQESGQLPRGSLSWSSDRTTISTVQSQSITSMPLNQLPPLSGVPPASSEAFPTLGGVTTNLPIASGPQSTGFSNSALISQPVNSDLVPSDTAEPRSPSPGSFLDLSSSSRGLADITPGIPNPANTGSNHASTSERPRPSIFSEISARPAATLRQGELESSSGGRSEQPGGAPRTGGAVIGSSSSSKAQPSTWSQLRPLVPVTRTFSLLPLAPGTRRSDLAANPRPPSGPGQLPFAAKPQPSIPASPMPSAPPAARYPLYGRPPLRIPRPINVITSVAPRVVRPARSQLRMATSPPGGIRQIINHRAKDNEKQQSVSAVSAGVAIEI